MKPAIRNGHLAYTLVEVVLVTAILGVVLGSVTLFGSRSADALGASSTQSELDTALRRTLARMDEELLPSGLGGLTLAPGADAVTYRRSEGVVNGMIRWSAPLRLAFVYERGELDDGIDNNGNGLVDEGVVVWTRQLGQPDEQSVILCHGVSEGGLVFESSGGTLRVSLTLERKGQKSSLLTRTLQATVQPRN